MASTWERLPLPPLVAQCPKCGLNVQVRITVAPTGMSAATTPPTIRGRLETEHQHDCRAAM